MSEPESLREIAGKSFGEVIDLSVGSPTDPAPHVVVERLREAERLGGYPASAGFPDLRAAYERWVVKRFGMALDQLSAGMCLGTKEFIASLPGLLRTLQPDRDVLLYPSVSYPTYRFGAEIAGLQPVAVPLAEDGVMDFERVDRQLRERALLCWVNAPSNPTGVSRGIKEAVDFGEKSGCVVASDECYVDYVWSGEPTSAASIRSERVLSVHSLSKRSNLAGLRVGGYLGDPAIVSQLLRLRREAGLMIPGPIQIAAIAAYEDEEHVAMQRSRYHARLVMLRDALAGRGFEVALPEGGIYLWFKGPSDRFPTGRSLARYLAEIAGVVVSPGDQFGADSTSYVRMAMCAPTSLISLIAERISSSAHL
ncbi:MAG: pyridoxal phosphate-dependent aminotransferase [Acidimicrobiales bacterium]